MLKKLIGYVFFLIEHNWPDCTQTPKRKHLRITWENPSIILYTICLQNKDTTVSPGCMFACTCDTFCVMFAKHDDMTFLRRCVFAETIGTVKVSKTNIE